MPRATATGDNPPRHMNADRREESHGPDPARREVVDKVAGNSLRGFLAKRVVFGAGTLVSTPGRQPGASRWPETATRRATTWGAGGEQKRREKADWRLTPSH